MSTAPTSAAPQPAAERSPGGTGRAALFHAAAFLAAAALVFSRRPDAFLNAQFFAEDGVVWYSNAYQLGLRSLLLPEAGYLHTLSRLAALLAVLFPLAAAPLVMNLCALLLQVLPVNLFLSRRFSGISLPLRLLGCFLYLALPNTFEIDANMTTVQWHLALLACLVLFARPGKTAAWRVFDIVILALLSVDGPMGVLLTPVAFLLWWARRDRWHAVLCGALIPGAAIQSVVLLFSQSQRAAAPNGASFKLLLSILGRQIFLAALLGIDTVRHLVSRHGFFAAEVLALAIGVMILAYAFRLGSLELKLFIGFAALVMALSLARPLASDRVAQWQVLSYPGGGDRYYFFPLLAFFAALVWMAVNSGAWRPARYFALALLLLSSFAIARDWRYPPFLDLNFREYAREFDRAAPGTRISIPINPRHWHMELIRK